MEVPKVVRGFQNPEIFLEKSVDRVFDFELFHQILICQKVILEFAQQVNFTCDTLRVPLSSEVPFSGTCPKFTNRGAK